MSVCPRLSWCKHELDLLRLFLRGHHGPYLEQITRVRTIQLQRSWLLPIILYRGLLITAYPDLWSFQRKQTDDHRDFLSCRSAHTSNIYWFETVFHVFFLLPVTKVCMLYNNLLILQRRVPVAFFIAEACTRSRMASSPVAEEQ